MNVKKCKNFHQSLKISSRSERIKWNDQQFKLLLFADDIVLMAQDEGDMQRMLDMAYERSQSGFSSMSRGVR